MCYVLCVFPPWRDRQRFKPFPQYKLLAGDDSEYESDRVGQSDQSDDIIEDEGDESLSLFQHITEWMST